jgi:catalase
MPLPTDEKILALSEDLISQFDAIFGLHPGFRPAHAKGLLVSGNFTPAPEAASLTNAPHILRDSTPVEVRFSNSTGLPLLPDNDPNANPRGLAIRFHLAEHVHTDIVSQSTDGFPTRTGKEFLDLLRALASSNPPQESPSPIEKFLSSHPAALAFVQTPKPTPSSLAREAFFGVTALRFINAHSVGKYGRYRIIPEAGIDHLDAASLTGKDPNFLFDELSQRLSQGPVQYQIEVQIAGEGDVVDDSTIHWPKDRQVVPFGKLTLTELNAEQASEQKQIIFDPIPRVEGIEPSADPLLELRAAIYLLSGRRRRKAEQKGASA